MKLLEEAKAHVEKMREHTDCCGMPIFRRMVAEMEKQSAVIEAARRMPRATPGPGGCSTKHPFEIEASTVWELDRTLNILDAK